MRLPDVRRQYLLLLLFIMKSYKKVQVHKIKQSENKLKKENI